MFYLNKWEALQSKKWLEHAFFKLFWKIKIYSILHFILTAYYKPTSHFSQVSKNNDKKYFL